MPRFFIEIPPAYENYIESAVLRLRTLFPEIDIEREADTLMYLSDTKEEARKVSKEISNVIYREKIFEDTKEIRNALMSL